MKLILKSLPKNKNQITNILYSKCHDAYVIRTKTLPKNFAFAAYIVSTRKWHCCFKLIYSPVDSVKLSSRQMSMRTCRYRSQSFPSNRLDIIIQKTSIKIHRTRDLADSKISPSLQNSFSIPNCLNFLIATSFTNSTE